MNKYILSLVVVFFITVAVQADLFYEDFESKLSKWVGKDSGAYYGQIVGDPLGGANHVLTFTQTNWGGDIFATSSGFDLTPGQQYTISFRYLGDPTQGGTPGNLGGFAGLSSDLHPIGLADHPWYYGTYPWWGNDELVDDRAWHSYSYTFTAPLSIGNHIHLMFEDFYHPDYNLNNVG